MWEWFDNTDKISAVVEFMATTEVLSVVLKHILSPHGPAPSQTSSDEGLKTQGAQSDSLEGGYLDPDNPPRW